MRNPFDATLSVAALLLLMFASASIRAETVVINWQLASYAPIDINTGDSIRFEWTGNHNVWRFTGQTAYNNCNFTGAVNESNSGITNPGVAESGPATVLFDSPGTYYIGCGVGSHCPSAGMKIQVNVSDAVIDPIFQSRFELDLVLKQD